MDTSVVTSKGQIVIPSRIREYFHIQQGTMVCFEPRGSEIVLKPLTPGYFDKMAGILGTSGKVLKRFLDEKKKERRQ